MTDRDRPPATSVAELCRDLKAIVAANARRTILGITGPPGSGKSTLAQALLETWPKLGEPSVAAVVCPMDGFHYANAQLDQMGLRDRKGAPETFDVGAFVRALRGLREADHDQPWPTYSRVLHEPVGAGVTVDADVGLVIVEGNYLLLDEPGWNEVRPILDECWFVVEEIDELRRRLIDRQIAGGRNMTAARRHVEDSDLPNVRRVAEGIALADRIVRISDDDPYLRGLHDPATGSAISIRSR